MGSTSETVVMRTIQCAVLLLCVLQYVLAQRRGPPPDEEDESYGNSVRRPSMDLLLAMDTTVSMCTSIVTTNLERVSVISCTIAYKCHKNHLQTLFLALRE